jgi:alkylation response protein AidB-like acyl-CoA dehydrogenase
MRVWRPAERDETPTRPAYPMTDTPWRRPFEEGRRALQAWRLGRPESFWECDPFLQGLLRRRLGERFAEVEPELQRVGAVAATAAAELASALERPGRLPQLEPCDAVGDPVERVVFHPDYHELGRLWWASGVLAVLAEPGSEVLSGALAYLLGQNGEAGHACPVACTAGAIRLLQEAGGEGQRRRFLPGLLERDYGRCLRASQFVTEVQGGSDVGRNACVALPESARPGAYRLHGEKWFCSVADADLFVVSARPPGAAAGTAGLGLFLVSRQVDGHPNGFHLRRLKDKLGTRALATAEIELDGALAEPVGSLGDGFKNLVGIVLDTSRVHNAISACAAMRRAYLEAWTYAAERTAFGRRLRELPAVRALLARMKLRAAAGTASTFRILAASDRLATGPSPAELAAARRVDVMLNKYWTALRATQTIHDAIEILGGNGTIEDFSVLPRLYRDALVMESWEGPHNTLCAQILRDFRQRGLHEPWLAILEREVETLERAGAAEIPSLRRLLAGTRGRLDTLLAADEERAAALIRPLVDDLCRAVELAALMQESAPLTGLYRMLEIDRADAFSEPNLPAMERAAAAEL